ncbi:hypothetical protein HOLDEFILI_01509 [Holdemania filiformis DSM 12042]|uniref:Uncharacterized protein n=1 Tax=Holdemania filiformis DSM 12042 TaxID=545696 RepID=B9Y6R6_9FIRM|nr:hypothetical protein HOLDEFILI_01509 [Holdemania filiformis DSM 12042]
MDQNHIYQKRTGFILSLLIKIAYNKANVETGFAAESLASADPGGRIWRI